MMISKVYISHSEEDEALALELSSALWRVGLESYVTMYRVARGISRSDRVSFAIRSSDCLVALLTAPGTLSRTVNQEIGMARGIDHLIFPILEEGSSLPFLIENMSPIAFRRETFPDAIYQLVRTLRELSRLDWLKVSCPKCGEEMTQYITPQEDVDHAFKKGSCLETICTYCQNNISLDPRTFSPLP
ncbi:MAG TPA: toll/interleukin-1 receptor domain-containing protein [Methanotrichaceae archaeon]|nr:toll/interleukin-1 receptor domain-containing protein [Methanotrichaceae archaeon]